MVYETLAQDQPEDFGPCAGKNRGPCYTPPSNPTLLVTAWDSFPRTLNPAGHANSGGTLTCHQGRVGGSFFPVVCNIRLLWANPEASYKEPTRVQRWSECQQTKAHVLGRMKRVIERSMLTSENSVIPPQRDGYTGQVFIHLKLSERG